MKDIVQVFHSEDGEPILAIRDEPGPGEGPWGPHLTLISAWAREYREFHSSRTLESSAEAIRARAEAGAALGKYLDVVRECEVLRIKVEALETRIRQLTTDKAGTVGIS